MKVKIDRKDGIVDQIDRKDFSLSLWSVVQIEDTKKRKLSSEGIV